jgi:hypothetical protein
MTLATPAAFAAIARRLSVDEQLRATHAFADALVDAIREERERCLAICAEHFNGAGGVADKIAREIGAGSRARYTKTEDVGPFGES